MGDDSKLQEMDGAVIPQGDIVAESPQSGEAASKEPCFVVAIGASAGGEGPLEHIFTAIPTDCNLSFIVAMHLPPEGPSLLPGMLGRSTTMPVLTAEDGMPLSRDTVHVIPPGKALTLRDGRLRLEACSGPAGTNHPIDRLFHSIAAECGELAIAVVLSGYGTDGAEGAMRIKEGGGVVLVQEPGTSVNPGMPQSAIATGAADMVLPMEEIAERIAGIARGHCNIEPWRCLTTTLDEELRALNEELVTVNAELQGKVEELNKANSDLENLFASSGIAAIFLDRGLIIKRFSPAMAAIFNLIPADIGRPFRHLEGTIDWPDLSGYAQTVLEKHASVEREVKSVGDGRCFIMRVLPYWNSDGRIDGVVVTLIDITELRNAEESIRSAALFPLENPSPVLRVGRDGTLLFANRSSEPLLAMWHADCGKDVPDSLRETIEGALADGVSRELDVPVEGRHISFVVTPIPERGCANLYGRVITAWKRAEEGLRRAKEEWERTFDSVPDLIAIMDDKHRIVRVNRAMAERLGVSPEQCVGQYCYHSVHGTDKPPGFCPHVMTLADGREHLAELHGDNLGGDLLVITTPLLDEKGRSIGSVHVARDITEWKRAEEGLEASRLAAVQEKSRLEAVMETLPVGVAIIDALGGNIRSNSAYEQVWGARRPVPRMVDEYAEYKAWWIETGQPLLPEEWASARAVQKDETVIGQLLRIERFDGTHGYIHNNAAPIHDADGRIAGSVVAVMDITEQMETKESLRLAKEAAEAANLTKSLFLANMSHELRTPMTGVLGMLEIASIGPLDEKQREAIDTARMSGHSLLRIINDILDLTRIETGKLTIEEKPFDLRECVAGVIDILITEARRRGLDLFLSVADDLPQTVEGDKVRLQQVMTNVVGNAVKFTERGKVEVTVTSGRETPEGKREVTFTVSDTGIGIPADKKELIFQSFCQADASHTRQYGGTGLGLSISREIVERMGGAIACESTEGKGSNFSFTIPFLEACPESSTTAEPVTAPPVEDAVTLVADGGKARLLIAEDDEVTRKVLGFMLQSSGFDFEFAMDGRQAVEMWEQGEYDLVVMDGQMPGMDGFAATAAIRERERERGGHIPIVAMTAHALKLDKERCLACGMDAYVSKPIDFKKCIEVIRCLIDQGDREN